MLGGAMYAWERAFKRPDGSVPFWAKLGAVLFAAFAVVATLGTGSAVQSSAMTGIICGNFPMIPKWAVSLVIAVFVAVVIFGGVKSITSVCERLVPFMAAAYTIGCLIILVSNAPYLGQTLSLILECAFTSKAAFGGAVGSGIMIALQYGCARGLFSNESGLGTAPIVAAAASTRNPARQALIASTGTFWSTVVICLITGLVLVSTMLAHPDIVMDGSLQAGADLANAAFATIPYVGTPVLVIGMVSFAYSTILGWSYYGNRCATYLFGKRATAVYSVLGVVFIFLGSCLSNDLVWSLSDLFNQLMVLPNALALLALSSLVVKAARRRTTKTPASHH